jgi:asparagine synthase (glutamine-hydrolysing)
MTAWRDLWLEGRWDGGRLAVRGNGPWSGSGAGRDVVGEFHAPDDARHVPDRLLPSSGAPRAGAFAGMTVDPATRSLLFATDPFGIRALFYWSDGSRVVCATSLAHLSRASAIPLNIDWGTVYHYLNFGYVPGPATIYRDVFVLPPGTLGRAVEGKVELVPYWDMAYPGDAQDPLPALTAALRHRIEQAVRQAWPGDAVPTGCFLSGGTDSGAIAAIASSIRAPLKAYSIAFTEDAYDELSYARMLAERLPLEHHVHHLTAADLLESIPLLSAGCGQPFGNPSIVATWRCARLARETGTELLLAGDGGDELFGGNERYAKDRVYALYERVPSALRRSVAALARHVPGESLLLNRIRNVAYRGTLANPERHYSDDALASRRWDSVTSTIRAHTTQDASLALLRAHWDRIGPAHEIDRLMYVDLKTAIWSNDLVKVMTAARMAGLRVRFPFLDPALAAFTGRLRPHLKVRGREKRWLFKRALADLLPPLVLHKPKHGFGVPVSEWIRGDRRVREAVLDPIRDSRSLVRECFTAQALDGLADEHLHGRWDHGSWLWALAMLARWHESRARHAA